MFWPSEISKNCSQNFVSTFAKNEMTVYRIAGYFQRVFILGYFEEASFFKNKFFVIAKKQHVIAPYVININIS